MTSGRTDLRNNSHIIGLPKKIRNTEAWKTGLAAKEEAVRILSVSLIHIDMSFFDTTASARYMKAPREARSPFPNPRSETRTGMDRAIPRSDGAENDRIDGI